MCTQYQIKCKSLNAYPIAVTVVLKLGHYSCPLWLCLVLTWAACPCCPVHTLCSSSGFVSKFLSFICFFTWGIWGDCPRGAASLGFTYPSCPFLILQDQLGWELRKFTARKQSCPWYLDVIEGLMCFPMWLSRTARVGDTFFGGLYCGGFRWCSQSYCGGVRQHTQAHGCGPLYDDVSGVEPKAKGALSQLGWALTFHRFLACLQIGCPVFPAVPKRKCCSWLFGIWQLCNSDSWCWVTKVLEDSRGVFSCWWCEKSIDTPSSYCIFF